MTAKTDGGPAFPRPAGDYNGTRHGNGAQVGISMRDYFAAKAMQAAASNPTKVDRFTFVQRAEWAYRQADAMLAARENNP